LTANRAGFDSGVLAYPCALSASMSRPAAVP